MVHFIDAGVVPAKKITINVGISLSYISYSSVVLSTVSSSHDPIPSALVQLIRDKISINKTILVYP